MSKLIELVRNNASIEVIKADILDNVNNDGYIDIVFNDMSELDKFDVFSHLSNTFVQNTMGSSALMFASMNGNIEIVKLLLSNNANTRIKNMVQNTALGLASEHGFVEIIKIILNKGVDSSDCSNALLPASHFANSVECVKLLLESGANVNAQNSSGYTALMYAASNRNLELVKLLLSYNADASIKNDIGHTPLSEAKKYNYSDIVELLENN